jgi:hypothetical protein
MLRALPLAAMLAARCGAEAPRPGMFTASVARHQLDTVRLRIPVVAQPCSEGSGLLISGVAAGDGVLMWLAGAGATDTGAYTISEAADSVPTRHARVSFRYMTGDLARAVALDSGTVRLTSHRAGYDGEVGGSGSDPAGGLRPLLAGAFRGVRPGDPVPCRLRP